MPRQIKLTEEQLSRNSGFGRVLLGVFSFQKIPTEFVAISQNARRVKQNLQVPGLAIKIAACAKNRYQTIRCGHGDTFSYLIFSCCQSINQSANQSVSQTIHQSVRPRPHVYVYVCKRIFFYTFRPSVHT